MDIGYGDMIAPGGYKYVLLIVDRKTQFSYLFDKRILKHLLLSMHLKNLMLLLAKSLHSFIRISTPKYLVTNSYTTALTTNPTCLHAQKDSKIKMD